MELLSVVLICVVVAVISFKARKSVELFLAPVCVDDAITVIEGHDPTMAHHEMMQEGEECQSAPLHSEVVGLSSSKEGSASRSYSVVA